MTLNQTSWNSFAVSTLMVVTIAVSGCKALTPGTENLITQPPKNSQLFRTLSTNSSSVFSVAYSPKIFQASTSVEVILASGDDKSVKVWNPNTGQLLRTISEPAQVVSFSPNGQILATGSGGSLELWNLESGKLIRTLKHAAPVIDIVFSPDGQTLASGLDMGSQIRLWNWRTGEIIRLNDDPNAFKMGFDNFKSQPTAFSPDGQTLFAKGGSGSVIHSWNVKTGKRTGSFDTKSSINAVAISPDGNTLATGIRDNAIKLWNVSTGKLIHTLTGHGGEVRTVAFSPDGKHIASGSRDGTVKLWNVTTGQLLGTFTAHREVWSVAFNPDGKTLASGGQDGTIKFWRVYPQ